MANINTDLNIDMISNAFDRTSDETMVIIILISLILSAKLSNFSKGAGKWTGIPSKNNGNGVIDTQKGLMATKLITDMSRLHNR